MIILYSILFVIVSVIALLLIAALFIKKEHYVKRTVIINAPSPKVFEFIKLLKNQDTFNKHAMTDPERERVLKGTDGTVGFIYSWSGNKDAGEGEKEIIGITEGKSMEAEIRFIKPMKTSSRVLMETEAISENQTKLSWSNRGRLKYPFNLFVPLLEKRLPKDMDQSLLNLKEMLEK